MPVRLSAPQHKISIDLFNARLRRVSVTSLLLIGIISISAKTISYQFLPMNVNVAKSLKLAENEPSVQRYSTTQLLNLTFSYIGIISISKSAPNQQ